MTKKHSTKKALLASALSLLLCVSMLVGTTFAWFTDSVTSANNIIKSGNLDVKLEYSTDMNTWAEVTETTNVFKANTNWEPGYTEVVYLRVSNMGSLAMKYKLGVNVANETEGKTRDDNTPFKLSDYIEYGIAKDVTAKYADRTAARAAITSAAKLNVAYSEEFRLVGKTATATDTDVYALVVYMPESVGNEANHNGTDIPVINLGLSVLATQDTVESDSFNNQYDKDAWHPDMEVTTAADLQAALNNGVTNIALADDIDLEEPIVIPAPAASTYSLRRNANAVVINLNGKKITSNLTSGRAILVQGAAEIKNGTITTTNGVGAIFATGKSASLILTDMTVAVTGTGTNKEWILTAVGAANGAKVVINNGTYSAEKGYGLVVSTTGADVTINDGIFTTEGTTESAAVRFDSGWDNSKVYTKAVINGGVFNAPEGGFAFTANNAYGKDITINGGTFNGKVASHYQDNGVVINGGIFNDKLFEGGNHTDKYQIKGGTFSFDPTKRVAEGFKVVDANGTYYVVADDVTVAYDAAGLNNAIAAGKTEVVLAEGDYALRFTNHTNFNLNDMTIKGLGNVNLSISSSEAWYGRVQGSNVTFENIHFTSSVGATGKATYNNCTFDGWTICASSNKEETTFNNCTINGCLNTSTDFSSGDVFVNNCIIAKAEYSGSMTMNFVDCQIGEIIIWNANTNLTNCKVTKLDDSNVTTATVTIK